MRLYINTAKYGHLTLSPPTCFNKVMSQRQDFFLSFHKTFMTPQNILFSQYIKRQHITQPLLETNKKYYSHFFKKASFLAFLKKCNNPNIGIVFHPDQINTAFDLVVFLQHFSKNMDSQKQSSSSLLINDGISTYSFLKQSKVKYKIKNELQKINV